MGTIKIAETGRLKAPPEEGQDANTVENYGQLMQAMTAETQTTANLTPEQQQHILSQGGFEAQTELPIFRTPKGLDNLPMGYTPPASHGRQPFKGLKMRDINSGEGEGKITRGPISIADAMKAREYEKEPEVRGFMRFQGELPKYKTLADAPPEGGGLMRFQGELPKYKTLASAPPEGGEYE